MNISDIDKSIAELTKKSEQIADYYFKLSREVEGYCSSKMEELRLVKNYYDTYKINLSILKEIKRNRGV